MKKVLFFLCCSLVFKYIFSSSNGLEFKKFSFLEITDYMQNVSETYSFCSLGSIGESVEGREMNYLKIGSNNNLNKPELEFMSNMHGDETVGVSNMLHFINYLVQNYENGGKPDASEKEKRVLKLLDEINIYIFPTVNPDAYVKVQRENANQFDLNRNFPDIWEKNTSPTQKEVSNIIKFGEDHPNIILGIHFHGGELVVSYPFDSHQTGTSVYSKSDDDELFKYISLVYAQNNPSIFQSTRFTNGITNGADWYSLFGGIQDYQYLKQNIFDITVELSMDKNPSYTTYSIYWEENLESMLKFAELTYQIGVKGIVHFNNTPIEDAVITVQGNGKEIKTNKNGTFWRPLINGKYTITASKDNKSVKKEVIVPTSQDFQVILDFDLSEYKEETKNQFSDIIIILIFISLAVIFFLFLFFTVAIIYLLKLFIKPDINYKKIESQEPKDDKQNNNLNMADTVLQEEEEEIQFSVNTKLKKTNWASHEDFSEDVANPLQNL